MNIKKIIRTILGPFLQIRTKLKKRKKRVSYGDENPDKIFYVIGFNDKVGGLSWFIHRVLMHIGYAIDKGYIPVVDMQSYQSQYDDEDNLNCENVWEYYFMQPMGITLNDIKNSKNIIISSKTPAPNKKYFMGHFYNDEIRIAYFQELFEKFIFFNESTKFYIHSEYEQIIGNKNRVMGVLCRGTDYLYNKPKSHPVQPDPIDMIEKVKQELIKNKCSYVFLATEDEDICELFKSHFKEKLLLNSQRRISYKEMSNFKVVAQAKMNVERKNNNYLSGLEYLSALFLLSKCTCFIGGRTGGTKAVMLMTRGFEYTYIYDLGYYQ